MQGLADINAHFWLTRGVARAMDISLSEAMAQHRLSAEDYAAMVTACRAAGCAEACAAWLAQTPGPTDEPPPFCAHADQLRALCRRA
jgi:hypothetical protein